MARVFIITQDEPVYAPAYLAEILAKSRHPVVGITALSPGAGVGWGTLVRRRLQMYGPRDFLRAAWLYGQGRLKALVTRPGRRGPFHSVAQVAARHGVTLFTCADVNAAHYLDRLRSLDLDVIVSVSANQKFRRPLLDLPRLACVNVHSALLPKYRGVDGLFWALVHGEREVGVTVHVMNERLDAGPILAQRSFPVEPGESLHRLFLQAIDVGSTLVADAIEELASGTASPKPNDIRSGSYFSWPTAEAARTFRQRGHRFF
jgi:methionyl-tRNA formyltransferase